MRMLFLYLSVLLLALVSSNASALVLTFDPSLSGWGKVDVDMIANGARIGSANPTPNTPVSQIDSFTVTTSAGNTMVSVDPLRIELPDPALMNDSGIFDLGLSGQIPYSITFEDYSWTATALPVPLAIDGTFTLPLVAHLAGVVDIAGSSVPFSMTFNTVNGNLVGDLDALGENMFQIALDGRVVGTFTSPPDSARTVHLGTHSGVDLALRLRSQASFSGSAIVPEPTAALLLAYGIVGLAARRTRLA